MNNEELEKRMENLENALSKSVDVQGGTAEVMQKMVDTHEISIEVTRYMLRWIKMTSFIINILVLRVFAWDNLVKISNQLASKWPLLSEGYKILILSFFVMTVSGIVAQVVGNYIWNTVKNKTKK